ncbi:MAG: hypothetical protein AAF449_11400 [Myxococcota bacterium]
MTRTLWISLLLLSAAACSKAADRAPAPAAPAPASAPVDESAPEMKPASAPAAESANRAAAIGSEGVACASSSACPAGFVCTTESGACDRPPNCGPNDICPAVCYGLCERAMAPPKGAAVTCIRNNDCRTFSDYCGGCNCEAIGVDDEDPMCGGEKVKCVADPCQNKVARCVEGQCIIADP